MKEQRVLSIKELTKYIKMKLEGDSLLSDVWVRGEISNFTHHSSGHMYFTLKDEASRIKSIMFASHNQKLAFKPKEGMMIIAKGNISVFDRDGQYQLYLQHMQPDGIGSLFLAFEQLKSKLEQEGLFAPERKKPIPRFPKAIGVITSPTGAAVRDIIITLQRRYPMVPVLLYPVLVQGAQAAPAISTAIEQMNRMAEVDVLIVGRGGGSLEELWPFNEEQVARSIYASTIPIISAVGHETDFTIADFVADLRAATPTAAAELAVPHYVELRSQVAGLGQRLTQSVFTLAERRREQLTRLMRSPYLRDPMRQLVEPTERLDRLSEQLRFKMQMVLQRTRERTVKLERALSRHQPQERFAAAKNRAERAQASLMQSMLSIHKDKGHRLTVSIRQLDALSPLKIMQRGYSLVYSESDQKQTLVKSLQQVQLGDKLTIQLTDGRIDCQVWSMEEEEPGNV